MYKEEVEKAVSKTCIYGYQYSFQLPFFYYCEEKFHYTGIALGTSNMATAFFLDNGSILRKTVYI